MNITTLFDIQKEKNTRLAIDESLNQYKLSARKHLELQIKLSSLADETKCYKYWLNKNEVIDRNLVFIKYLDFLGQILTLGLDKGYTSIEEITLKPNDYCLSDQFLNLYIDINDLIISPSHDHFQTLLEDFLSLGMTLGYSETSIREHFAHSN